MKIEKTGKGLMTATALSGAMVLAGCGGFTTTAAPSPSAGIALHGMMHGGQQPVVGATMTLYAAGTGGYGGTNSNVLTKTVTTGLDGSFDITGDYPCTPGQQMYIVGAGGDPGGGPNANLALMTALGDCNSLPFVPYISVNEVTTVASVFALAPFMSSITSLSTSPGNTLGLAHAFASVNKLVDVTYGAAPGSALPAGASAPTAEINTLANILSACVNSQGGVANDQETACGSLFGLTTPPGGAAPTDTIQALVNLAHNPTQNAALLFPMAPKQSPFYPVLQAPPSDWTLAVIYTLGGFSTPSSTTVDANGSVWIANRNGDSVSVLAQSGAPLSGTPYLENGVNGPAAIGIDAGGNAWVANADGTTVSAFTPTGGTVAGSPFAGGGTISKPSSLAIDASGDIWVANTGNNSIVELNSTGGFVLQETSGVASPGSIAINPR
jgi:hypothetical protein